MHMRKISLITKQTYDCVLPNQIKMETGVEKSESTGPLYLLYQAWKVGLEREITSSYKRGMSIKRKPRKNGAWSYAFSMHMRIK